MIEVLGFMHTLHVDPIGPSDLQFSHFVRVFERSKTGSAKMFMMASLRSGRPGARGGSRRESSLIGRNSMSSSFSSASHIEISVSTQGSINSLSPWELG